MSLLSFLHDASGPSAAVELTATHVSGARLDWRRGQPAIAAHAVEPLAAGALVASLTAGNILDRPAVANALRRVLGQIGRPGRIALIVPDLVAKVSVVKFEQVPRRAQDLEQLVRWQIRKTAPFPIDEAQITYAAGQRAADGQEFLVSLARRDVIEEYEQLAADSGAQAGVVDLATFNVVNAVLATQAAALGSGDWLLVNVASDYATLAIVRGPDIILFRSRAADTEGSLFDLVHQTTMYYEDRLEGRGFTRVILASPSTTGARGGGDVEAARRGLQDRLAMPVDGLDLGTVVTVSDRIAGAAAVADTLAPIIGVLLRGQESAA